MSSVKIAILASGSGSNAENIFNYFSGRKDVEISLIISNKANAYVHERARKLGISSLTLSKEELGNPGLFLEIFKERNIDFIVLAGYMLKIPQELIELFPDRIVNIHPALLPKHGGKGMYGDHVHAAVIESGDKESGITIHFVNEYYDEGRTIFQAKCPVNKYDTPDSVASKVHALEYEHYPKIIDKVLKKTFPDRIK
jgi:phosphoribosylglycinamide formyltransferase 1